MLFFPSEPCLKFKVNVAVQDTMSARWPGGIFLGLESIGYHDVGIPFREGT